MTVSNAGPGTRRAARLALEDVAWGTVAVSPTWHTLVFSDVSLHLERPNMPTSASAGEYGRRWNQRPYKNILGGFTCPVWPDLTTVLLDLCYDRESDHDMASYTVEVRNAEVGGSGEAQRYLGCKCNSFSLTCGEDQHDLQLQADLIGYDHSAQATFADPAVPTQVPFGFSHATFELPLSTTVYSISNFNISVENSLAQGPHTDSGRICALEPTECSVSGSVDVLYTLQTYSDLVRNGTTTSFNVTFNYPGTGSPIDSLALYLPNVHISDASETGARNELIMQTLTFDAFIPAAGGRALQITTS